MHENSGLRTQSVSAGAILQTALISIRHLKMDPLQPASCDIGEYSNGLPHSRQSPVRAIKLPSPNHHNDILDPLSDKYTFVAEQTANFAREEGDSVTEAILAGLATPPDVIVAANDDMALGALQVTQEQNLDIVIIGFDALPEALGSVRDGGLTATIEQFPGGQSRTAMQAMVKYLRDGTAPEPLVLLTNGLVLLNVSSFVQQIVIGVILVAAVAFDQFAAEKRQ